QQQQRPERGVNPDQHLETKERRGEVVHYRPPHVRLPISPAVWPIVPTARIARLTDHVRRCIGTSNAIAISPRIRSVPPTSRWAARIHPLPSRIASEQTSATAQIPRTSSGMPLAAERCPGASLSADRAIGANARIQPTAPPSTPARSTRSRWATDAQKKTSVSVDPRRA